MTYKWVVLWFFAMVLHNVAGQLVPKSQEDIAGFGSIPQEKVYVHTNASFLLTGEYLYYKVYCLDAKENGVSRLSKVSYVELRGKEGVTVFRHKVLLKNGLGQGDFFIPTEVASGVYKLIAYTRWMQNTDEIHFYQEDLTIVNPYRSNQPQLQNGKVVSTDSLAIQPKDTVMDAPKKIRSLDNNGPLQLKLKNTHFRKRQKVMFSLARIKGHDTIAGTYSVSIRKKDGTATFKTSTISNVVKEKATPDTVLGTLGNLFFLPELRGELFQGKVTALQEGNSVKNLKVGISIPGEDYVLEVVQTDDFGNFLVNINKSYGVEQLYAQVISQNFDAYTIKMNEPNAIDDSKFDFKDMNLNVELREEILRRSVHSQIENSYFQFRPDSIVTVPTAHFLDNKDAKTYQLNDYTRFRTVRETLLEIIQDVSSKRIGKDDYVIRVKGYDYTSLSDIPPLILLDGLLIQNHNALLDFDARKIDQVKVYRHELMYGPEIYEGAMILSTEKGEGYASFGESLGVSGFTVPKPRPIKKYFVQRYDETGSAGVNSRLPDDRLQLLWFPSLELTEKESKLDFFTSDVTGEFEIKIEGITTDGRPVSIRSSFMVE
jgi:hypothetical protein